MNATRQKQQKEELLQEQSNSRVEAESKAKVITTETCKKIDEEMSDLKRQYNLKMVTKNKVKKTLKQQQPQ